MNPEDVQNRPEWYEQGEKGEGDFVGEYGCLGFEINPAKQNDPLADDLLYKGDPAELKHITTPFYTAAKTYNIPADSAVQLGLTPYVRYRLAGKLDLKVVFWVDFREQSEMCEVSVPRTEAVVSVDFGTLAEMIESGEAKFHTHTERWEYPGLSEKTRRWLLNGLRTLRQRRAAPILDRLCSDFENLKPFSEGKSNDPGNFQFDARKFNLLSGGFVKSVEGGGDGRKTYTG